MQKVSPLVIEIGKLINARIQTLETNIRAEIKASEGRTTNKLTKQLQVLEDKLVNKVSNHKERIEKLEEHIRLSNPTG